MQSCDCGRRGAKPSSPKAGFPKLAQGTQRENYNWIRRNHNRELLFCSILHSSCSGPASLVSSIFKQFQRKSIFLAKGCGHQCFVSFSVLVTQVTHKQITAFKTTFLSQTSLQFNSSPFHFPVLTSVTEPFSTYQTQHKRTLKDVPQQILGQLQSLTERRKNSNKKHNNKQQER